MDFRCTLTPAEWLKLRQLARENRFTFGMSLLDKIKAEERRWTEDNAIEVHRVTEGAFPCWRLRPDLWAEGQIPPCLVCTAA